MNLTPKKHFQEKKQFADAHRDLVVSTPFREALHAALIDQVIGLENTVDPVKSAAGYQRILGARDFIEYLLSVAEMPKPIPAKVSDNLPSNIR